MLKKSDFKTPRPDRTSIPWTGQASPKVKLLYLQVEDYTSTVVEAVGKSGEVLLVGVYPKQGKNA